jgi:hypothetical protein
MHLVRPHVLKWFVFFGSNRTVWMVSVRPSRALDRVCLHSLFCPWLPGWLWPTTDIIRSRMRHRPPHRPSIRVGASSFRPTDQLHTRTRLTDGALAVATAAAGRHERASDGSLAKYRVQAMGSFADAIGGRPLPQQLQTSSFERSPDCVNRDAFCNSSARTDGWPTRTYIHKHAALQSKPLVLTASRRRYRCRRDHLAAGPSGSARRWCSVPSVRP